MLASCKPADKPVAEVRPVRTVTVAKTEIDEPVVLTGHIQAQDEVAIAFRVGGRMLEVERSMSATSSSRGS